MMAIITVYCLNKYIYDTRRLWIKAEAAWSNLLPGIWNQAACVSHMYKTRFMGLVNVVHGVLSCSRRLSAEPEDA